jgi:hypothetical protein
MKRFGMFPVTRCGVTLDELQEDEHGEWCRFEDHERALAEARAAAEELKPYQVLHVVGTQLGTLRAFWARDDAHARKLAGTVPRGAVLVREVARD